MVSEAYDHLGGGGTLISYCLFSACYQKCIFICIDHYVCYHPTFLFDELMIQLWRDLFLAGSSGNVTVLSSPFQQFLLDNISHSH